MLELHCKVIESNPVLIDLWGHEVPEYWRGLIVKHSNLIRSHQNFSEHAHRIYLLTASQSSKKLWGFGISYRRLETEILHEIRVLRWTQREVWRGRLQQMIRNASLMTASYLLDRTAVERVSLPSPWHRPSLPF